MTYESESDDEAVQGVQGVQGLVPPHHPPHICHQEGAGRGAVSCNPVNPV